MGGARADCSRRCDAYRPYLCISRTAYSVKLEHKVRAEIKKRFSVCLPDPQQDRFFRVDLDAPDGLPDLSRPTISVSVIDCDSHTDWRHASLREWPPAATKGCKSDVSLLLVVLGGTRLVPVFSGEAALFPIQTRNTTFQKKRLYSLDALRELFDDVYGRIIMPPLTEEPREAVADGPYPHQHNHQHNPGGSQPAGNEDMEHSAGWPTWAIVVLIVSVVLSVVAFFIGNFINKRNSPRPLKQAKGIPMAARKRNWGAGFSGGMWAAA